MRILVCGSRTWDQPHLIEGALFDALRESPQPKHPFTIIQGMAKGADLQARKIAVKNSWPVEDYPADWQRYGRAAGFIRNQQMLDEGKPDLVLAFWDGKSKGTLHMIDAAKKAGIKVEIVTA